MKYYANFSVNNGTSLREPLEDTKKKMTTVYQILVTCGNGDAWVAYESEDEAQALARYEQEVASAGEPVDVSDWGDNDQGWKKLYQIELLRITYGDLDSDICPDIIGEETIKLSDYFNRF